MMAGPVLENDAPTLRILVVSDLHGDIETPIHLVERLRPDLLLSPGDWGDPGEIPPNRWHELLARVHVLTVSGNHDDTDTLGTLRNRDGSPVLLNTGRAVRFGGFTIAGISGIWAKSHRMPYYITDADVDAAVAALVSTGTQLDVLVTHGCPLGVVDLTPANRHGGQAMFSRALRALRPRLYACGHLHRRQMHGTKDGAILVNSGDGRRGDHWLLEAPPTGPFRVLSDAADGG